ncbi:uncharacterized protein MONOS_7145c2 [Monocercomonoides exilis]|uniref:uncharacterized protein n=1 Tax=Monocercomonoides exilis TaxID=2049356 RepID=UPI00355977B8|nr:hypothetical protein MONOS_7145c1 [Monocercomonoides exilis]KAH7819442.1 hypothetical protein MONOS_7145c2 [Monocercomonoides exilis]|eukprot:MONOS_7145.1-p1 / transcript=MONOS_7145.1 / gene=MONOS_7145 / organism=Monocercomonoides_exilis_PA203 / gene_product=unspecified product / transcript_product=unspecified product / location=Mono_scaffold00237:82298-82852(-) / protein_length=105 / sequence_SO=supercontig / SO=protein_coding / is_pseudo=false
MRRKWGVFGVSGVHEEEADIEYYAKERVLLLRKKRIVADEKGEAAVVRSVFAVNVQFLTTAVLSRDALKESSARSTAVAEPKNTRVHSQLQTPLEKALEMERKE